MVLDLPSSGVFIGNGPFEEVQFALTYSRYRLLTVTRNEIPMEVMWRLVRRMESKSREEVAQIARLEEKEKECWQELQMK